jgi:hypothetical protein
MVKIPAGKGCVAGKQVDNFHHQRIELLPVAAGFFAAVVSLETSGVSNLPH